MTFAEIETILGADTVRTLQRHILEACSDAQTDHAKSEILDAMSELLVANLAALLVIPQSGAVERVTACNHRLEQVVKAALKEAKRRSVS